MLTATPTISEPDDTAATVSHQWQSSSDGTSWSNISSATGSTHLLVEDDENKYVRVHASFTGDTGANSEANTIAAYSPLFAILVLFAITAAFPFFYSIWQVHGFLVQQQTNMQSQLRKTAADNMVLSDVRIGIREMTLAYKVSLPRRDFDIDAVERGIRESACIGEIRTKIRDGAIYNYEFIDSSRDVIGRFAVASCP
jgi:hypothetical protein